VSRRRDILQHLLGLQLHLLHLLLSIAVFSIQRDISYQAFLARYTHGSSTTVCTLRDADLALTFLPTRCGSRESSPDRQGEIKSMLPSVVANQITRLVKSS